ncbi:helix-turn-helix transcriptional regulator [Mahella australiensis]|uniref:Transcriptional regulator, AraC family n=1 Tax=Mahella australiensis (strain DSM 15567 / CIP 107919 / 50-1 BON) TaxID=697281 RepID=F3ZYI2_MAHA5|nr:AraC family transcriptional regulator [Mahella australiensis]AEE96724.1 transcriptional regulator, AraC family [Mahella australiensis 50-1 BON]
MDFDFSKTNKPTSTVSVALNTVYVLYADPTYDVYKSGVSGNDMVALRTLAGEGKIKIEGYEEITVTPWTLIFCKHRDIRRYYCSDEMWDFWWFEFVVNDAFELPLNRLLYFDAVDDEIRHFKVCLEMLRMDNYASKSVASATFSLLLHRWMVNWYNNNGHKSPHQAAIENIIAYIKANPGDNVMIKAMADAVGLSERRFREVFKSIVGQQPKKFIESIRLDTAEELLKNTPLSINEIAFRLGYCSPFHFSKAFREAYGVSPSQFRRG